MLNSALTVLTSALTLLTSAPTVVSGEGREKRRCGYFAHANEGVGLKCKRLIDLARLNYLRQNGLETRLLYYVDRATSLENVLLLATHPQSKLLSQQLSHSQSDEPTAV